MEILNLDFLKMNRVKFIASSCLVLIFQSGLIAQQQVACEKILAIICSDTDKLDHLYLATEKNAILKIDKNCNELYRYTNNYLGYPSRIDASNPINVICFYPAQQTIVTLDVTMNEISRTNLVELGFMDVRTVCSSNDGNIWILDALDFKLKKINRFGKVLTESENLMLVFGRLPDSYYMLESQNLVYMVEENFGVHQFDNFGNYKTTVNELGVRNLQVTSTQWIFSRDQAAYIYYPELFKSELWDIKNRESSILMAAYIRNNNLFIVYGDRYQIIQR